jgi:hypothetical protein
LLFPFCELGFKLIVLPVALSGFCRQYIYDVFVAADSSPSSFIANKSSAQFAAVREPCHPSSNCRTECYSGISSAESHGNRLGNMYNGLKELTTSGWVFIYLLLLRPCAYTTMVEQKKQEEEIETTTKA